jgi:hypothetical protein
MVQDMCLGRSQKSMEAEPLSRTTRTRTHSTRECSSSQYFRSRDPAQIGNTAKFELECAEMCWWSRPGLAYDATTRVSLSFEDVWVTFRKR